MRLTTLACITAVTGSKAAALDVPHDAEADEGIHCIAVPIFRRFDGVVSAQVSAAAAQVSRLIERAGQ